VFYSVKRVIFNLKMHENAFWRPGSTRTCSAAYNAPPDPLLYSRKGQGEGKDDSGVSGKWRGKRERVRRGDKVDG